MILYIKAMPNSVFIIEHKPLYGVHYRRSCIIDNIYISVYQWFMNRVCLLNIKFMRIWKRMVFKNYILTTLRLMLAKWWLSLIKIFSLTSGIISFLLVWLFYFDHQKFISEKSQILVSCTLGEVLLLVFILLVTTVIYFFVMKSQISARHKELFFRKLYGETHTGIIIILMIETSFFILIAFVLSLVFIDQIAPLFNLITEKNVNLRGLRSIVDIVMIVCFLSILGFMVGILPSIWYAKNNAVDILKKLH